MSKNDSLKPLVAAIGAAFAGTLTIGAVNAAENPFGMTQLDSGYLQVAESQMGEGKCGGEKAKAATMPEGKCGGSKAEAAAMPEGKCGGDKAKAAAMPEGKCGGDKAKAAAMPEGKCGQGKCGANKKN